MSEADPSFSNVSGSHIDGADYTAFIDTIIAITTEVEITFSDGSTKMVNVLETDAAACLLIRMIQMLAMESYFPS